jgi:hypothetical protein
MQTEPQQADEPGSLLAGAGDSPSSEPADQPK